MSPAHHLKIYNRVIINQATERTEQVAQIGPGEGVAKAIGKGQHAASILEEAEDLADFIRVKEGASRWLPAFPLRVVSSGRCGDDEQVSVGKEWVEWFLGGTLAGTSHIAQKFGQTGKVGVPLPRGETGLTPVSLAMGFIEEHIDFL